MGRFRFGRALAFVAALLGSAALSTEARAERAWISAHEVTLDVAPIFGAGPPKATLSSPWTELVVDVRSSGEGFQGWLDIIRDGGSDGAQIESRHVVSVGKDQRVRLQVPVQAQGVSHSVALYEDFGDPAPVISRDLRLGTMREDVILVAGVNDLALPPELTACRSCPPNVVAAGERLPRWRASYDNLRVFAIEGARLAAFPDASRLRSTSGPPLDDAECNAMRGWVETGGALLVVRHQANYPATAVPLRCGLGDWPAADPANELIERRHGEGRIAFASAAYASSTEGAAVIGRLYEHAKHARIVPHVFDDPARFGRLRSGAWLAAIGASIFGFSLVSGPLLFSRLRRRNRADRALALIPLGALSLLALLLGMAALARPDKGVSTVSFFDYANGQRRGRGTIARGFMRPDGVVRTARMLSGPEARIENVEDIEGRGHYRIDGDGSVVLNETKPKTDFVYLVESGEHELAGPISIACTHDACTIQNESENRLEAARLVVPHRGYVPIGRIDTHSRVTVRLDHMSDDLELDEPGPSVSINASLDQAGPVSLLAAEPSTSAFERTIRVSCWADCEAAR